ncbi:glutamate-rich protein 3 [Eucyclogobius newberryi]|uniref:glutamate-rich protein 3 n=1 Tax=Eucyclogobius newberryi TaxID=166745 RepID=UPI003B5944C5
MSLSHLNPGLISAYNSLTDKHLAGYFSSSRIRRHLQRAGLITRSGRIVPDKEYRQKLIQKAHQRHVRECLAQAIFHKVLEMERLHQIEIKRKLEEFARRDKVHKIKVERSKRYDDDIIRILSPRPPTGARGLRKQHSGAEGEHSESSESPGSSRPNTAPGKMQRPVRLKPLHSNSTTASHRHSSPYRRHAPPHDNQRPCNGTLDKDVHRRRLNSMEVRNGVSPYCLPVINNFVTPVPPSTKRKERPVKLSTSSTHRGQRLRPTTASSGAEDPPVLRSSVPQSKVCVYMVYLGKSVHVSHDLPDMRDEVRVFQQHCGGENLCVYKGKLREGECFQFISRRHRGFPFSLTFFLNGLQVERLSSCCEFKHRKSSRLGGRHGHFAFSGIEAASPCYKCIIAMGLDKKPVPPPKRVKEDGFKVGIVPRLTVTAGANTEATEDNPVSRSECESSPTKDTETTAKEDKAPEDSKAKDDYEEDFEADDEGPVEEEKEKKSNSQNEEKEETGKEKDASDSDDSGKDDDRKSHSESSFSGSESEAEEVKEVREEEGEDKAEDAQEVQEETQHVDAEAARATESTEAKDCEIQDSAGQSTEIEISDTSAPSGNETRAARDMQSTAEGERRTEDEPERAKSVQEKLAEAILKESICSSEPELSDTSTETTEVGSSKSTEKETNEPETTRQPEMNEEEKKIEVTLVQEEVKLEDETTKEPEQIAEVFTAQNDNVTDKTASEAGKDEDTGEKGASEEIMEEVKCSPLQDEPSKEAEKAVEESEQEAQSVQKEHDSAEADNTEPLTVTGTLEGKAEASDTQEANNAEVAPATDAQTNHERQDAVENTELESDVIAKDGIMRQDDNETENAGVTDEVEEDKEEKESDLKEVDKDKTQEVGDSESMGENKIDNTNEDVVVDEAGTNSNTDGQDKVKGAKSERDDLENCKPESEPSKEENMAEYKDVVTDLTAGDQKGEDNKAPSEEGASDTHKEEIENAEAGDGQNRDTSKEKCVGEDVKNEEEVEQLECGVRTDANKKLNESENQEKAIQKEEEEQETTAKLTEENGPNEDNASDKPKKEVENTETSDIQNGEGSTEKCVDEDVKNTAPNKEEVRQTESEVGNDADKKLDESDQHESSIEKEEEEQETKRVKLTEENAKSDEGVTEEALKEIVNSAPASDELEKDHKNIDNDVEASEVDAENGEASLVAEPKETDEDEQKRATTENTTQEEGDGVSQAEHNEKQEKTQLEQENDNSGNDLNGEASIPSNQEEIAQLANKDLDTTENNNSLEPAQSNPDKPTGEQVSAVDVFAGEGENGDTEEASKASEEGASVLLKPHDKSSSDEPNEQKEQKGSPEGLTTADSTDLVNNWVTMHQTSKYFETFVEPLEGIRDMKSETSNAQSSESPVKVVTDGEDGDGTENTAKEETSDQGSDQSKQDAGTKDVAQAEECEASQVADVATCDAEGNVKGSVIEDCLRSVEDKIEHSTSAEEINDDSLAQLNNNLTRMSIASSGLSVTVGKHETASESLNEEKQSDRGQEVTMVPKAEERPEYSDPLKATEHRENGENKEATAMTDLTALQSDSRSQLGSNKIQTSSVGEDKREVMGETNTVSKEHQSSFSVDDPVFGNSSFPLVTASKAESGH